MQEKVEYCENSVNRFSTQFLYKWGRDNMNNCSLVYNGVSQATKWCSRERVLLSSILHTKGAQHFDRLLRFSIFTEIFVRVPIYSIAVNIRICSSLLKISNKFLNVIANIRMLLKCIKIFLKWS